jgi:hypothetical protein
MDSTEEEARALLGHDDFLLHGTMEEARADDAEHGTALEWEWLPSGRAVIANMG